MKAMVLGFEGERVHIFWDERARPSSLGPRVLPLPPEGVHSPAGAPPLVPPHVPFGPLQCDLGPPLIPMHIR